MRHYYVRRRNAAGHYVQLGKFAEEPECADLQRIYGFGVYSIFYTDGGVRGTFHLRDHHEMPHVEFVRFVWLGEKQAKDIEAYVRSLGPGYFLVSEVNGTRPIVNQTAQAQTDVETTARFQISAQSVRGFAVFRAISGFSSTLKQCPKCCTNAELDAELCKGCGHSFLALPEGPASAMESILGTIRPARLPGPYYATGYCPRCSRRLGRRTNLREHITCPCGYHGLIVIRYEEEEGGEEKTVRKRLRRRPGSTAR